MINNVHEFPQIDTTEELHLNAQDYLNEYQNQSTKRHIVGVKNLNVQY